MKFVNKWYLLNKIKVFLKLIKNKYYKKKKKVLKKYLNNYKKINFTWLL